MIKKITPDNQKSKALKLMAEKSLERLKETNIDKYPSNSLSDYYDIIHKLLDSIMYKKGVKIKGEGAHYELIEYCFKINLFNLATKNFLQDLREYRNKIEYEGFNINKEFIQFNKEKIEKIIENLKKL
ncbi:MAG: hypothetical protein ACMXX9_02715 [Candidatus Woesearchaeota archaeon]